MEEEKEKGRGRVIGREGKRREGGRQRGREAGRETYLFGLIQI